MKPCRLSALGSGEQCTKHRGTGSIVNAPYIDFSDHSNVSLTCGNNHAHQRVMLDIQWRQTHRNLLTFIDTVFALHVVSVDISQL